MAYHDGGFYFLQPVGSGYGALALRNRGYGASQPALRDEKLSAGELTAIQTKYRKHVEQLWAMIGTYNLGSKERAEATKRWENALSALVKLDQVVARSKAGSTQTYKNLPERVQGALGDWIKKNLILPRYAQGQGAQGMSAAERAANAAAIEAIHQRTQAQLAEQALRAGGGVKVVGLLSAGGGMFGGKGRASSSPAPGLPSGAEMIPAIIAPSTTMGPQVTASETEQATAVAQADLSQQAIQTVSAAQQETAGSTGLTGVAGMWESPWVKGAAAVAVVGGIYYVGKKQGWF